jgi:hypothetical protein
LPSSIHQLEDIALQARGQAITSRDEWNAELIATPIVFAVLIEQHNEDFDEMLRWIRLSGSDQQMIEDYPMVYEWKQRCAEDPTLMEKIRAFYRTWTYG